MTGVDADTVDGTEAADLEESAEIDADIAAHTAVADTHHAKTTSFSELTDTIADGQIPGSIARDGEVHWTDAGAYIYAKNATGLAIKVGYTGSPAPGNNFITFYNGSDTPCGAIEGNHSDGILLRSGGADYAECLARLHEEEEIGPGDVVGLFGDKVSKRTEGAERIMVVSRSPILLGNDPGEDVEDAYERVAFLGQVEVKVCGVVKLGDVIVSSRKEDGTAVAVAPEAVTPGQLHHVLGQALEASEESGVKYVRVLVGLDQGSRALGHRVKNLEEVNGFLQAQNAERTARLASLETQMNERRECHRGNRPGWLALGVVGLAVGTLVHRRR